MSLYGTRRIVLGHIISKRGIEVDSAKIEVIENLQPPKTVREIRSCSAHAITPHLNTPNILIKSISKSTLIRVNTANEGCHN